MFSKKIADDENDKMFFSAQFLARHSYIILHT